MKNKKLAVIVGRFQANQLHKGYAHILEEARKSYDHVLVIFGESYRKYTKHNPLPPQLRRALYITQMHDAKVLRSEGRLTTLNHKDHKSDAQWCKNLDLLIEGVMSDENCTEMNFLIGRDSFDKYYSGKFKQNFVVLESSHEDVKVANSTEVRQCVKDLEIAMSECESYEDFAAGIIHTVENQYPRVDSTVDVAPTYYNEGDPYMWVLLSRKATDEAGKFRFFGGFVDVSDKSLEEAAARELFEESQIDIIDKDRTYYVSSRKIFDWRYRDGKDGVMTTLFRVPFMVYELINAKPSDDLEGQDLLRIRVKDLLSVIVPEHKELAKDLIRYEEVRIYANN